MGTSRAIARGIALTLALAGCAAPTPVDDAGVDASTRDAASADASTPDAGHDASHDAAVVCRTAADCDDGLFCNGAETCGVGSADADVHGCLASSSPCHAPMMCSESTNACVTTCPDGDHDGHTELSCGGDDCDDAMASVHPGATEVCNAIDDNCDGTVDEGVSSTFYLDVDHDGFGDPTTSHLACTAPAGEVTQSGDCNDTDPSVSPSATESCNRVDDDCDATVDEGATTAYWTDADADGFGASGATPVLACTQPAGTAPRTGDCNDAAASVYPLAPELCDGVDDDCNGLLDGPGEDVDGDGIASQLCGGFDCDDHDASSSVGVAETCNMLDDDCDGDIDEGTQTLVYRDADGDGFGTGGSMWACIVPAGYAAIAGDCDDGNPLVSPGIVESCDLRDDDCDGLVDEGVTMTFYADADHDTFGGGAPMQTCTQPAGTVLDGSDCDDTRATVHPGAPDLCDGLDNDCVPGGASDDLDGDGFLAIGATCSGGPLAGEMRTDCDDTNANVHPFAAEICDGRDDDCNGTVDGAAADTACRGGGLPWQETGACVSGSCVIACTPSWADCSGAIGGCETDTRAAYASCGGCGMPCAVGQTCSSSTCVSRYVAQVAFGGAATARPYAVVIDSVGNVYVAGYLTGSVDFGGGSVTAAAGGDVYIASYTPSGAYRWLLHYAGGNALTMGIDAADNLYVGGRLNAAAAVGGAAIAAGGFLASYTSAGVHRWSRSDGDYVNGLTVDPSGNVIAVGPFPRSPATSSDFGGGSVMGRGNSDLFVASYTSAGVYRWAQTYGGSGAEGTSAGVTSDPSGNLYIANGGSGSSINYGGGAVLGSLVFSLTSTGTYRWQNLLGGYPPLAFDPAGHLYFQGNDGFPPRPTDIPAGISLWQINPANGFTVWRALVVGTNVQTLAVDASGNIVAGGSGPTLNYTGFDLLPHSGVSFDRAYVFSYDVAGNARWSYAANHTSAAAVRALATRGTSLWLGVDSTVTASWGGANMTTGLVRWSE